MFNENYYPDQNIVDCFEKAVEKFPDNTALVFKNINITYRELNEKANKLVFIGNRS